MISWPWLAVLIRVSRYADNAFVYAKFVLPITMFRRTLLYRLSEKYLKHFYSPQLGPEKKRAFDHFSKVSAKKIRFADWFHHINLGLYLKL
jgi:hypothetical protein